LQQLTDQPDHDEKVRVIGLILQSQEGLILKEKRQDMPMRIVTNRVQHNVTSGVDTRQALQLPNKRLSSRPSHFLDV